MKSILLVTTLLIGSLSMASTTLTDDEETGAIEALNIYCGSSTKIYQNQIINIREAVKAGKFTDSQIDQAVTQLADLKADIKARCH